MTLDPAYEDAADLLAVAQESQERAKIEARQQIEQVRLRRQSTVQQHRSSAPPVPASRGSSHSPDSMVVPRHRRARPWMLIAAIAGVLILALMGVIWLRQPARPTPVATGGGGTAGPQVATSAIARATSTALPTGEPTSIPATVTAPTAPAGMAMGGDNPTSNVAPIVAEANGHNMAGSQAEEPGTLATPQGKLVYEDDFEADASAESAKTGLEDVKGDAEFNPGFHTGVYRMDIAKSNDTHAILLPRLAFGDFSMHMDLWDDSDTPSGDVALGVVFRARDDAHFYTVLVDPRIGQYAIRELNGKDTWSDLVAWKPSPIVNQKTNMNHVRVDAAGKTFTIYLNGQMIEQFTDTTSPDAFGMLGMIAANVDAIDPLLHFDNLKIWSNDAAGHAPEPDTKREMIRIPAGPFIMGSYLFGDQKPQIVTLGDFLVDRTEVTNTAYKQCIDAGKCEAQPPGSDTHPNYANDPRYANFPASHVSWQQARNFCAWAGKRLPTEAEWEKAASWNATAHEKSDWPWGNTFAKDRLNSAESNRGDTTAVGTFPPEMNGTVDMAGNVSEWTSSLFKSYPYNPTDGRENLQDAGDRVYRGGSYLQTKGKARGYFRRNAPPVDPSREIGFRCAATP